MTVDERFERIETDLAGTTGLLRTVAEIQQRQAESLSQITESFVRYVDQSDARLRQITESMARYVDQSDARLSQITESIARYTDQSDARLKRIEENLDGLIRAITAEHGNGKKH